MTDYREEFRGGKQNGGANFLHPPFFIRSREERERVERMARQSKRNPVCRAQAENRRDAILEDERGCTLQGRREEGGEGEGEIESVR